MFSEFNATFRESIIHLPLIAGLPRDWPILQQPARAAFP